MGGAQSEQEPPKNGEQEPQKNGEQEPPKKPTLTESPWREVDYDLKNKISSINPKCRINALLLGPTNAGKSSTINSILSVAKGRRVNKAYTGNKATSFTTTYKQFMDEGIMQHCCLCDSMGIEQVLEGGLLLDDLEYLLKGHIKDGYRFNPRSEISVSDAHFRRKPQIKHGIHCVVFVLDACMVDGRTVEQFMPKITALQDRAHSYNIPCILILTKIDRFCQKVHEDVRNTFRSVKVQEVVKTAADMFGIPEGNIHPIKNFEVNTKIDDAASNLVLAALQQIMYYASDNIEEMKKNEKCIVS